MPGSSRLPSLGPRGEGWVAVQLVVIAAVVATTFTGVYWPDAVTGGLAIAGAIVVLGGVALFVFAALSIRSAFSPLPRPRPQGRLAQHGAYRIVRHPIYGAVLLLAFGWSLAESPLGLIPTALLAVVFDLKARLEERWLEEKSPEYAQYRVRTPRRFVPGVYELAG
jgi:protein-S-isoprenylcysteine O-methyltransferase Ste14